MRPSPPDPALLRWEVTALGTGGKGPYALVVHHARGTIVEYFTTTPHALTRAAELDELLTDASGTRATRSGLL